MSMATIRRHVPRKKKLQQTFLAQLRAGGFDASVPVRQGKGVVARCSGCRVGYDDKGDPIHAIECKNRPAN